MHVKNQLPLRFIALGERTTSACRAQIIAAITQGGNGNYSIVCVLREQPTLRRGTTIQKQLWVTRKYPVGGWEN